eukprot:EG_transcript_26134
MLRRTACRLLGLSAKDPRAFKAPKELEEINFNRTRDYRRTLIMNLLTSLVKHDVLKTTWFKARAIQPIANQLVELAKRGDFDCEEKIRKQISEPWLVDKMLADYPIRFAHRKGLYVRVTPLMSRRKGDAAERAIVELEDRHLSLDRLYPPMVSYKGSPTVRTLLYKQREGRWADEDPNYDSVLVPFVDAKRHPLWAPEDDEVSGREATARLRRGALVGRNRKTSEWLEEDDTREVEGS